MEDYTRIPKTGEIVSVRQRLYLVEDSVPPVHPGDSDLLKLACLDDDAQGQPLDILWNAELDRAILDGEPWNAIAERGFDQPRRFAAYLNTLRWNCVTYRARKRLRWPGQAAVVVSVVHVSNGVLPGPYSLDRRDVPVITAYLFHAGGHGNPACLRANKGTAFEGAKVYGLGFTFSKPDDGVSSSIETMRALIEKNHRNAERIFPYLVGEEFNNDPSHAHQRFVINFADFPRQRSELLPSWRDASEIERKRCIQDGVVPTDYPYPVAADWPDLLGIVEARVKPERDKFGENPDADRRRRLYWLWGRYTPALFAVIEKREMVLALSRVSNAFAFAEAKPKTKRKSAESLPLIDPEEV
jgi:hypothetical protein